MRIAHVDSFSTEWVGLVRVRTDDGNEGWGQVAPYNADITTEVLHRQVAPHALGGDPLDPAGVGARILEAEHKFPGSYLCRALAGLDTALWDLRGRLEQRPVYELLGAARRALPVYASSMRRDITPAAEASRLAGLRERDGYTAFKVRVGRECGRDQDEWPGRTEELLPAVRRALGDDATLLVDANSGYSAPRAIEVGRFLEQHGVVHFEEPCPYWLPEETAKVTAALDLAVAGGEQDCLLSSWRTIVGLPAVDIVQPDVCYAGGLTRTLAVAEMAAGAGLRCVLHSANLTLVTVFALHAMAAIANAGDYVELSIEGPEYYPWQYGLYQPELQVVDGRLAAPDGPGWGVEPDPRWLAQSSARTSSLAQ
ncbi:MAG TPA: mandelate racemase/muconate lactonizing enzyme family protein [Gaiellales bacterium]|jgi:L-alanine-DL-glutamate epimerase-like enolase superfamily enzyme|nr:mandelate racemase/muconate lactonizing enzyme family protein [Gaiellales bacterium]